MAAQQYAHSEPNRQQPPTIGSLVFPANTIELFARNGSNGALEALIVASAADSERSWRLQSNHQQHSSIAIAEHLKAQHWHVDRALRNLARMGYATLGVIGLGVGLAVVFEWDAILGELAR